MQTLCCRFEKTQSCLYSRRAGCHAAWERTHVTWSMRALSFIVCSNTAERFRPNAEKSKSEKRHLKRKKRGTWTSEIDWIKRSQKRKQWFLSIDMHGWIVHKKNRNMYLTWSLLIETLCLVSLVFYGRKNTGHFLFCMNVFFSKLSYFFAYLALITVHTATYVSKKKSTEKKWLIFNTKTLS